MTSIFGNTEEARSKVVELLKKEVPAYRQAYSDRTAWIMACLSELAYIKFNPLFSNDEAKDYLIGKITKFIDDEKKSSLLKLIERFGYDHNKEVEKLKKEISTLDVELAATFDVSGTQAILVACKKFVALAFRGTEADSIKDIKADAKANTTSCETGGRLHSGFSNAFNQVALLVQEKLKEKKLAQLPLFITGHSLGGALATIASKKLNHEGGIAACYTFGSPRVGDEEWISKIKTPVYRLVNSADCVTMLPPGTEIISVIGWICQFIPSIGKSIRKWLLANLNGYMHGGNMRYLTNCPKGNYANVKLLYSVSIFYRLKGLLIKKLPWRKFLSDHSISVYREKLAIIAHRNNRD